MARDTVFDLSSLTKPLATTTAVMLLAREGKLRPDDRVTRFIQNFGVHGKFDVTVRHLLAHCSGLPAWRPFYEDISRGRAGTAEHPRQPRRARVRVRADPPRAARVRRRARRAVYSDLGFLLLGELIELVTQSPLDRVCHERIFRPLGLRADRLRRSEPSAPRQARARSPTRSRPPSAARGAQKVLCGEVHDDNAWAVGGVAGHAGLFSTAARRPHAGVAGCARARAARTRPCPASIVRRFWTRDGTVPDSTWALGWDTPSATGVERRHAREPARRRPSRLHRHVAVDRPRARRARRSCSPTACIPSATTSASGRCGRACTTRCGRRSTHEGAPDRRLRGRHERARGAAARGRSQRHRLRRARLSAGQHAARATSA